MKQVYDSVNDFYYYEPGTIDDAKIFWLTNLTSIKVPTESVDLYKSTWPTYSSIISGY